MDTRRWLSFGVATGIMARLASVAMAEDAGPRAPAKSSGDARELVRLPEPMRLHTLSNMREHLLTLQEIDIALSHGRTKRPAVWPSDVAG